MSTSEKLKDLNWLIKAPDVDDMDSIHTLAARQQIERALPQIVAVVKAAEQLPEFFYTPDKQVHSFVPLLDDLDKALS